MDKLFELLITVFHPCTIYFKATCPVFCHSIIDLEYTGPDLKYYVSLPSDYMDIVCKDMQRVFGYGSFDRTIKELAISIGIRNRDVLDIDI